MSTPESVVHSGVTYAEIQGYRPLLLDLHVPAGADATLPVPVVVCLHGGAFWAGDRRHMATDTVFDTLVAAGIAAAAVDYRLSAEAKFPAQLDDVRAAIRYLRANAARWGLDVTRLGVWGESAGGILAALTALDRSEHDNADVSAAVVWFAPTELVSLRQFSAIRGLLGDSLSDEELQAAASAASPVTHVHAEAPAFLIAHGTADVTVPIAQSELLHAKLLAAGARSTFVPVPDVGHVFSGHTDMQQLVDQAVDFFARDLTSATGMNMRTDSPPGEFPGAESARLR